MCEANATSSRSVAFPVARQARYGIVLCATGCRFILGAIFLMAGASKLIANEKFVQYLIRHSGFDPLLVDAIAAWLPWLELTAGLCLLLGYAIREAAAVLGILLVFFTVYSLAHWGEGACGCFVFPGAVLADSEWWPSSRNLLLLGASAFLARYGAPVKSEILKG
jgi:uncharacterized membrane protein YphA (DoxX/SURF4 family)